MAAVKCILLVLFAEFLHVTDGQCDGTDYVAFNGSGAIQSPNYKKEYGHAANCSWKLFPPNDGKNYTLMLTITYLRLYYTISGVKKPTEYKLFINNDLMQYDKYIESRSTNAVLTQIYYDSPSCAIQGVAGSGSLSPFVKVKYTSDGAKGSNWEENAMGFRIEYKYTSCSTEITTTIPPTTEALETSTSILPTTKGHDPSTRPETTSKEFETTSKLSSTSVTSTKTNKHVTGSTKGQRESTEGQLSTETVLFLVSIPGFIGIIILIASAIIYCRGRNESSAKPFFNKEEMDMKELRNEEDKPGHESGEGDKLQTNPTAQSTEADTSALYSTIVKHTGDGAKEPIEI